LAVHPGKLAAPAIILDGGFVLDARSPSGIKIAIPYKAAEKSRVARAQVDFALGECYKTGLKFGRSTFGQPSIGAPAPPTRGLFRKDGAWGSPNAKGLLFPYYKAAPNRSADFGFAIPKDKLLYKPFVDGSKPFVKFKHPRDGKMWGIYLKIANGRFTFTFKIVPPGFWDKLWGWIKKIAAKIVEFVKDLYDFLKTLACPLAKRYLGSMNQIAEGKLSPTSPQAKEITAKAGVSQRDLSGLQAGTTPPTQAALLANVVVDAFCGSPAATEDVPAPKAGIPTIAWLAIAGGGLGLYLLWSR
jgi:hypothetical protein